MKSNLLLLIGFIISTNLCLKFELITDQKQLLTSYYPQCFLLTLTPESINQLTKQLKDLQHLEPSTLYFGVLGANKKLQRSFNIKRYPYLGCKLIIREQQYFYGMSDLVTVESVSSFLLKVQKYNEYTKMDFEGNVFQQIQRINQKYSNSTYHQIQIHIPIQIIQQNLTLLFQKLFYPLNLLLTTSSITTLIFHSHSFQFHIESLDDLSHLLKKLSLSAINEFGPQAYQQLTPNTKIFMLTLDSIHKRYPSLLLKQQIQQILIANLRKKGAEENPDFYLFWMESALNEDKQIYLGFEKSMSPPLLAEFILDKPTQKNIYPAQMNLTGSSVLNFIMKSVFIKESQMFYMEFLQELKIEKIKAVTYRYGENWSMMVNWQFEENTLIYLVSDPYGYPRNTECTDVTLPVQILKNMDTLVERVNKFSRVSSYLHNRQINKYKIVVIVGFPLSEGLCLSYHLHTDQALNLSKQLPIYSEQAFIAMFSQTQNLPDFWWVPQSNYEQYMQTNSQ